MSVSACPVCASPSQTVSVCFAFSSSLPRLWSCARVAFVSACCRAPPRDTSTDCASLSLSLFPPHGVACPPPHHPRCVPSCAFVCWWWWWRVMTPASLSPPSVPLSPLLRRRRLLRLLLLRFGRSPRPGSGKFTPPPCTVELAWAKFVVMTTRKARRRDSACIVLVGLCIKRWL